MRNTTRCYIMFFFQHMASMSDKFDDQSLNRTILYDRNYISMILMMDHLISNVQEFKSKFYVFLTQKKFKFGQRSTFRTIFRLHGMLFHFCLYKTFLNEDWIEAYKIYFLLSTFIQNLMEDNFYHFKNWFSKNNMKKKKKIKENGLNKSDDSHLKPEEFGERKKKGDEAPQDDEEEDQYLKFLRDEEQAFNLNEEDDFDEYKEQNPNH